MKVTVIGWGSVGGGLARAWSAAGHSVTAVGRDSEDATVADAIVIGNPGQSIAGKTAIDATKLFAPPTTGLPSLAADVQAIAVGPVANSFTPNFAALFDLILSRFATPGQL